MVVKVYIASSSGSTSIRSVLLVRGGCGVEDKSGLKMSPECYISSS